MKKNSQVFSQFLKNNVHLLAYMVMSVLLVASLLTQFLPTGVPLQNVLVFFFFFVCVGFVVFEHMSFLRAIAPNVRVHQIAQRYVGVYMRLLIVSIRFISYGALAFLSARVIRLTLRVFVHHQFIESLWFIVVLMFVMAMPAYMGYEAAWPMVSFFVVCALVMLVGTL
ncbi:MAG: hypothetical protein J6M18_04495, partial [Actinomycetaceae bacterium]|nr:hypothetical protein [Actinomycetaceae bacterium]